MEFKNIKIRNLDIMGKTAEDKARQLEDMMLRDILKLRCIGNPSWLGTIEDWIDGDNHKNKDDGKVCEQLQSYIMGSTIQKEIVGKNLRAFVVVIFRSHQILICKMDRDGKLVGEFELA